MRHFPNWIEAFVEFTDKLPSPELFRRWTAVSTISSALERKVWVSPYGAPLYPNTYITLVGPPGVGKSIVTSLIKPLFKALPGHHQSSDSVTKASMMDELKESYRAIVRAGQTPPFVEFHFLNIVSNELGTLIGAYSSEFMSALTDIYDGHGYSERRRTRELNMKLTDAQFNLIAATTPSYLAETLPAGAWDQGFLSRVMLVFSGNTTIRPLFEVTAIDDALFKQLQDDLKTIGELYGQIKFEPNAAALMQEWHLAGGPPIPEHPRLQHYNARRTTHLLKLCMIMSVAESNTLVVTEKNFIDALDLLVETESQMPEIFKAMTTGGDQRAIEEVWYWAMKTWTKEKKPIHESRIINYLRERVPAYNVEKILQVMIRAGLFELVEVGTVGNNAYKPRIRD